MIKDNLKNLLNEVLQEFCKSENIEYHNFDFDIEEPPKNIEADFATNICLIGAKFLKRSPKQIAEKILDIFNNNETIKERAKNAYLLDIKNIFIAGAGFLNFVIGVKSFVNELLCFVKDKNFYFMNTENTNKKILIEFVSANPTGPLHIGHARGAAIGDSLARLFLKKGWNVEKEYYVNNAGNQIQVLAKSLEVRYRQIEGENIPFPENHYQGEYMIDIAKKLYENENQKSWIDIDFKKIVLDEMLGIIEEDLEKFNIKFDNWFLESKILEKDENGENDLDRVLDILKNKELVKEIDGALWLNTTDIGEDDKDRVIIRNDGRPTYFANDIAYHKNKFDRGYDLMIDIWGADHHGYVPRLKASVEYLGNEKDKLNVILYQLVSLIRDGQKVAMSTRTGEFICLTEVLEEVGVDATRFFLLMRDGNSPLEFDLELAKKKSSDNPVYYVQYAHARIQSIINNAFQNNIIKNKDLENLEIIYNFLNTKEDISIIKAISDFKKILDICERDFSTHYISTYLLDLAGKFHNYYNKHKIVDKENLDLTKSRIILCKEIAFIIKNGLDILGVSAPDTM